MRGFSHSKGQGQRDGGPPRVVVIGGGYGGIYTALRLQKAARSGRIRLQLISRDNYFLFQPMLAEVVSGNIEPTHILNPIRRLCPNAEFYQAEIEAIDVQAREVLVTYPDKRDYRRVPYDHLVVAVGISTDLSGLPGVSEHAFPFRTLGDALFLRNHLIGLLERSEMESDPDQLKELMTFVVAGGGYTGVEVAAEINDFVREAASSYPGVDQKDIRVILLQGAGRILPELSPELAAFSHRLLERRGIEVHLGSRISGATAQSAVLADGTAIPTRTLVAAIGAAPNRLLDKLPCELNSRGRLVVDATMAVPGHPGVWAVGDCAAIPDGRGGTYPPTAQYALREARHLGENILSNVKGSPARPFRHRNRGVFVPLGRFSAAAEVGGLKVSGLPAWWMYRTYYLYQLPRLERKIRVFIDWNLALIFRRDIVQHDVGRSGGINRAHYDSGQVIFNQGDLGRAFYIILGGQVQVYRLEEEEETEVAVLGPGELLGEMALLRGVRRTASVRALTPVDLLVMSGSDFTTLVSSSSHFSEMLAGLMRQRLAASEPRRDSAPDDS